MPKIFYFRMFRKSLGLSQVELAKELGIAQGYISELESGKKVASRDLLGRLEERFGKEMVQPWISEAPEVVSTVQQDVEGNSNFFSDMGEVSIKEGVTLQTLNKALDEISEQRKLLTKAQEQIDRLITLLEKK